MDLHHKLKGAHQGHVVFVARKARHAQNFGRSAEGAALGRRKKIGIHTVGNITQPRLGHAKILQMASAPLNCRPYDL